MVRIAHAAPVRARYGPRRRQVKARVRFSELFLAPLGEIDPKLGYGDSDSATDPGGFDTLSPLFKREGLVELEDPSEASWKERGALSAQPLVYQPPREALLSSRWLWSEWEAKPGESVGAIAAIRFGVNAPSNKDAGWVALLSPLRLKQTDDAKQGTSLFGPRFWGPRESAAGSEFVDVEPRFDYSVRESNKATKGPGLPPVDWDQWDRLRNKRRLEILAPDEEREYQLLARGVALLDAVETARAERAARAVLDKHRKVVMSLERLADAIQEAAKRL